MYNQIIKIILYNPFLYLGEVGGLMGLLLGASVMTIFEFVDLIIYNTCLRCLRSRKVSDRKTAYKIKLEKSSGKDIKNQNGI